TARHCDLLRGESQGLENRILNLRVVLYKLERYRDAFLVATRTVLPTIELPPPLAPDADAAIASPTENQLKHQAILQRQAVALADQRLHLAELCQRFANAQSDWHAQRIDSVGEFEELAGDLQQRDEGIRSRT